MGILGTHDTEHIGEETFRASHAVGHILEVLDGAENASTGREARLSLETIVDVYVSEYTGSQVSVPLAEPLRDVRITFRESGVLIGRGCYCGP